MFVIVRTVLEDLYTNQLPFHSFVSDSETYTVCLTTSRLRLPIQLLAVL